MLHPEFIKRTRSLLKDEYAAFEAMLDIHIAPTSIRLNPRKTTLNSEEDYQYSIAPHNVEQLVPWCEAGRYLEVRPAFTYEPAFHAGAYYVQEASSMFLEQAVRTILKNADFSEKPPKVLDLCAAPGGKSTHLLALLPEESLLVSNEVIRSRAMILAENIAKWGAPNNIITRNDPKDFGQLRHFFDLIVADLPCSGEGMFRKDRASRSEWSLDNVRLCAARQRRIVHDIWEALRPGGWLIYSTCTFNTEENEDNVRSLAEELGAKITLIPTEKEWDIVGALKHSIPAYRFFPHRTAGEGFFLALMQKNGEATEANDLLKKHKDHRQPTKTPEPIKNLLTNPERFIFRMDKNTPGKNGNEKHGNPKYAEANAKAKHTADNKERAGSWFALPKTHEETYSLLSEHLNILSAGIPLGEFKGTDFTPSAALALSTALNLEAYPIVELSYEQAISYLEREAIPMPEGSPRGYLLVTFRNMPLGFVKNIGNRANNLYPQEWRIRYKKR